MSKKHTIEEAKCLFAKHNLMLLDSEYQNNKTKMKCFCNIHKIVLFRSYNDLTNGYGCSKCGIGRRNKERKIDFSRIREAFDKKGYILLSKETDYINEATKNLAYICPRHPDEIQKTRAQSILRGHGCLKCAAEKIGAKQRKNFDEVKKLFEKAGYELLSTESEYKNSQSYMRYKCPKHANIEQKISYGNFQSGARCRYCASQNSVGEMKIRNFLEKNNIAFESQKKFHDLKNPKTGYFLSYDFFLPQYNILIEYQGGYHDGKVHDRNPRRQTEEQLNNQKFRDELKRIYAKKNNYNLIEIWYYDEKIIEEILCKNLKERS